jgi:hypothetical protein
MNPQEMVLHNADGKLLTLHDRLGCLHLRLVKGGDKAADRFPNTQATRDSNPF